MKVVHFHNGKGGGVLTVIRNLLKYKQHAIIENHVIYTINKELHDDFQLPGLEGATSEQVFYYSPKWNFYHTCKQLSKLLPKDAIIIAHDWLELGMVSNLGLQQTVIQFLHGDYEYYYNLAEKHQQSIDCFICVSSSIMENLSMRIGKKNIQYLRFAVKDVEPIEKNNSISRIAFVGRLQKAKGYHLLHSIANQLQSKGIALKWEIFGTLENDCKEVNWPDEVDVSFHGMIPNDEIIKMLPHFDYFILPSNAEGMPVSLIEAMKAGLVSFVNDIEGGVQELVKDGYSGFKIKNNKIEAYCENIAAVEANKTLKKEIRRNSIFLSNELFNPMANTFKIEKTYFELFRIKTKTSFKAYGSFLDSKYIPNWITYNFRRI